MTQDDRGTVNTATLTIADPKPEPPESAQPRKTKRPYLHQVDLFRILTFACVVLDHVTAGTTTPDSVTSNAAQTLLHYTRLAFFALTAFVLIYQSANKPFTARTFWRRRFMLIGIPYVVWSVFYWAYAIVLGNFQEPIGHALWRLVFDIATGQAWYQMYFLLVTMQVYLLFPLLLKLLRATEGHHRWVLAVSGALQLGFLWLATHPPAFTGFAGQIWAHIYAVVFAYQFYVILGAVAAWHLSAVDRVVRRFGPLLVLGTVAAAVFAVWEFLRSTAHGMPPAAASNIFMPHMIVFFIMIIVGQYTLGSWWNTKHRAGSVMSRFMTYGSDRSFPVFLLHPFALQLLAPWIIPMRDEIGALWCTVIVYIAVMAMSVFGAEVTRRVPGSIWLNGRPMVRTDFRALFGRPARERPTPERV
ncbi:acyltransferase [Nocardia miyunensis]|uniref:acyltransferase n=1 Tax=Nocardia miyunensis TaxID=282684 RepID=UPI00082A592B|nr:acyltransferase [Nocardia miyunensis]